MQVRSLYNIEFHNGHYRATPKNQNLKHGEPEQEFIAKAYSKPQAEVVEPFKEDEGFFAKTMQKIQSKIKK